MLHITVAACSCDKVMIETKSVSKAMPFITNINTARKTLEEEKKPHTQKTFDDKY